jgi:hypothetical protein
MIAYAREVLNDDSWLETCLENAKREALDEFDKFYHDEINALRWGFIHIHFHKGVCHILADLEVGKDYRAWRIEFRDRHCDGIGFDD